METTRWMLVFAASLAAGPITDDPRPERIEVKSSIDGSIQPSNLFRPPGHDPKVPASLAVLLHTWSFDLNQRHPTVEREAAAARSVQFL